MAVIVHLRYWTRIGLFRALNLTERMENKIMLLEHLLLVHDPKNLH